MKNQNQRVLLRPLFEACHSGAVRRRRCRPKATRLGIEVLESRYLLASIPVAGDYNADGMVDAADYVVWRETGLGGEEGLDIWRANFGAAPNAAPQAVDDVLRTSTNKILSADPAGAYAATVLADAPIAYWRLGESGGTTAVNQVTGGVNGTYGGIPTLGVFGLVASDPNTAVRFDGFNDRVSIPESSAINVGGPYTEKTVEVWFTANDVQRRQVLYEQGGNKGLNVYIDGGRLYVGAWNPGWDFTEGSNNGLFIGTDISTGVTYHAVLVMDGDSAGTTGSLTGYLNGASFGQLSGVGQLSNHSGAVSVGFYNGTRFHNQSGVVSGSGGYFNGVIDEVALYNQALSEAQVAAHFSAGFSLLTNDTDADGDPLSVSGFSATSALGAIITVAADGGFVYDPTTSSSLQALGAGQSGLDSFSYTVGDGRGGTASALVTVHVTGVTVNSPPVLAPIGNLSVITGGSLTVWITASDPNLDSLIFSASGLPSFVTLFDNGNGTGRLQINPGAGDAGIYSGIVISVQDNRTPSLSDSETIAITVSDFTWTQLTSSPTNLTVFGAAVVNNKLYTMGGFDRAGFFATSRMHVYNPVADQWTRLADVPAELTHQAVAVDGNTIWSLGGTVGDSPGTVVDSVYLYDVTANTWSTGLSLPAPRGGGQTVILGRNLHFFGGFLPDRQTGSLDHWVMNLDNLAAGWSSLAAMPEPRNHFAGVGLNGKIYALGGATGHDTGPRDVAFVHVYNPASNQWTQLASLPVAASHIETGTFVQDGRIFVTGGRSNVTGQKLLDTFYSYDPNTNSWSSLPPLPRPTRVHVARVINGMLIVGNGEYPHAEPQDEYYAIPWSIVQSALKGGAAPLALAASSNEQFRSVNQGDGLSSDGCGGGCPCGGLGCAACMPAPVELAAAPDRWTLAPIRRLGSPKAQVRESVLQPIGGNLELLKEYDLLGLSRSILARDKLFEEDSLRANELAEDLAHAQALRLDVERDFSPEIKKELDFSHYG